MMLFFRFLLLLEGVFFLTAKVDSALNIMMNCVLSLYAETGND